jgi:hypothetical protein
MRPSNKLDMPSKPRLPRQSTVWANLGTASNTHTACYGGSLTDPAVMRNLYLIIDNNTGINNGIL